jgi:hypothetical protein
MEFTQSRLLVVLALLGGLCILITAIADALR